MRWASAAPLGTIAAAASAAPARKRARLLVDAGTSGAEVASVPSIGEEGSIGSVVMVLWTKGAHQNATRWREFPAYPEVHPRYLPANFLYS